MAQQQHEGLGAGVLDALAADEFGGVRHRPHRHQDPALAQHPWSWTTEQSDIVAAGGAMQTSRTSAAAIGLCEQRLSCAWPERHRISSARAPVSNQAHARAPTEEAPQPAGARPAGRSLLELLQGLRGPPRRQLRLGRNHPHPVPLALVRPPPARHTTCRCRTRCEQSYSRPQEQPLQLQADTCMPCVLPDLALGSEPHRMLSLDVTGCHRR